MMNMKSQEYDKEIRNIKLVLDTAEGVDKDTYTKWCSMLDMLLQVKISMENFEINKQLDEQAEVYKKEEVTESIKRFNLGTAIVDEIDKITEITKDEMNARALKQHDLQVQNDCGLTEEEEFMSSVDQSDRLPNKEEMEDEYQPKE